MDKRVKTARAVLSMALVLYIAGFTLIVLELGWVAALGIFAVLWANNLDIKSR